MKQGIKIIGIMFLSASLSHCASMVNDGKRADKTGTRAVLGEKAISRTGAECPNGVLMVNLLDSPSGTKYVAGGALSSDGLDSKINVYSLSKLRHHGFDKENKKMYQDAPIGRVFNKIGIEFSEDQVNGSGRASTGQKVGERFDLDYFSNHKVYRSEDKVVDGFLRPEKIKDPQTQKLIQSVKVSIDNNGEPAATFAVPASVLGEGVETDYNKPLSAEVDGTLTIALQPSDDASILLVQLFNGKSKKDGITYEYQADGVEGQASVEVPLKGAKEGEYKLNIIRQSRNTADLDGLSVCVDVGSGIESSVKISKAKAEEKK